MRRIRLERFVLVVLATGLATAAAGEVRIKDLARLEGTRENGVLGYGIVVGLAGTGDSARNQPTVQSVSNMLREFGLQVPPAGVNSRNVAAVIVTASMPSLVRSGDKLDVNVAAIGDARSLAGGTLLMTPLLAANRKVCATAQGPLTVGGYRFEQNGNVSQKNFPTAASIPEGAVAECAIGPSLAAPDGNLDLLLNAPDYTTAARVAARISSEIPQLEASPVDAGRIRLHATGATELVSLIARIESLTVEPDVKARVVVNERTGTIVSGGDVWISDVTITHGDIKVSITQQYIVSQPYGLFLRNTDDSGIRTAIVPDTQVRVLDPETQSVSLPRGATIAELVQALQTIRASAQDIISILQGIKRSGALHAELIIQ